jgi:ribosomal protein S18 acetylase RimI-like enzyme
MVTSRPSITLRPARPDDLPALLVIEAGSFTGDRLSRRALRRWLKVPHARCLVAESAGAVVAYGLVSLHRSGRVARIYSLAVAPRARGLGLGGRLLAALENVARERGYAVARLEVAVSNTPARTLYEGAGYRERERLPAYYEDGGDGLRLEKRLDR